MPATGRKPNEGQPVRHRVKPTHQWIEVEDIPFKGGPPVPKTQKGSVSWPSATRAWWKVVSRMPHCVLWGPTDWMFMADTAVIHAALHGGDVKAATELRQREKVMGTTLDARRDLRIRYVESEAQEDAAGVTNIKDFRKAVGFE